MSVNLITPCGGQLVDLTAGAEERVELLDYARRLPLIQISPRAVCNLELIARI
jgi:sulfate adenylyltransferase